MKKLMLVIVLALVAVVPVRAQETVVTQFVTAESQGGGSYVCTFGLNAVSGVVEVSINDFCDLGDLDWLIDHVRQEVPEIPEPIFWQAPGERACEDVCESEDHLEFRLELAGNTYRLLEQRLIDYLPGFLARVPDPGRRPVLATPCAGQVEIATNRRLSLSVQPAQGVISGEYRSGYLMLVLGRDLQGTHLFVCPQTGTYGWLPIESVNVLAGNLDTVPVMGMNGSVGDDTVFYWEIPAPGKPSRSVEVWDRDTMFFVGRRNVGGSIWLLTIYDGGLGWVNAANVGLSGPFGDLPEVVVEDGDSVTLSGSFNYIAVCVLGADQVPPEMRDRVSTMGDNPCGAPEKCGGGPCA